MTRISALVSVVSISLLLSSCTVRFVSRDENGTMGQGQQDAVWVCHGNQNPRWHAVAAPAADAHRRHGDAVSDRQREEGASCGNVDRRTDDDRGGDDDQNGDRGGTSALWVCHGNQGARWVRVSGAAADAHRRHGDAVSSRPRATNSPCGAPDRRTDEGRDEDDDRAEDQGQGRDDTLWVCHGNRNPRWMSLPSTAADAHRRHGDPVSTRPRDQGSSCVNGNDDRGRDDDEARGQGHGQGQGQDGGRDEARGQDRDGNQGQGQGNRPDHAQDQGQDRGQGQGQGRDEARGQGQDRGQGGDRAQGQGRDEARGQGSGGGQGAGPGNAPDDARDQDDARDRGQDGEQGNGQGRGQGPDQDEARGQDQGQGQGQGQGRDQDADEARDRGQGQAQDRGRDAGADADEAEDAGAEESFVWICHGNRNPRWHKVLSARADAHRRHGDRVSTQPQEDGSPCQEALR